MKEIKVTFKTLTPLWTGDAWGENSGIRPSSIIGSLRFWFYIYSKSIGIETEVLNNSVPADNFDDYIKAYNSKETFESILEKKLRKYDYDTAIKNTLEEIRLPLISRIFGCTGWKSRIAIKDMYWSKYLLKKSTIDFSALYNKINSRSKSSEFWINKLLFLNKSEVTMFKNVLITLWIDDIFNEEFKKFLKFYEDKIILVGGKKSLGFGFCKIETDLDLTSLSVKARNELFNFKEVDNISNINIKTDKTILGFNFKHYQRLKERKKFREKNFGNKEKSSDFFFSTEIKDENKSRIYIIGFNDFNNYSLFKRLLNKYSNF